MRHIRVCVCDRAHRMSLASLVCFQATCVLISQTSIVSVHATTDVKGSLISEGSMLQKCTVIACPRRHLQ
jgi:hypothetical protein